MSNAGLPFIIALSMVHGDGATLDQEFPCLEGGICRCESYKPVLIFEQFTVTLEE